MCGILKTTATRVIPMKISELEEKVQRLEPVIGERKPCYKGAFIGLHGSDGKLYKLSWRGGDGTSPLSEEKIEWFSDLAVWIEEIKYTKKGPLFIFGYRGAIDGREGLVSIKSDRNNWNKIRKPRLRAEFKQIAGPNDVGHLNFGGIRSATLNEPEPVRGDKMRGLQ